MSKVWIDRLGETYLKHINTFQLSEVFRFTHSEGQTSELEDLDWKDGFLGKLEQVVSSQKFWKA